MLSGGAVRRGCGPPGEGSLRPGRPRVCSPRICAGCSAPRESEAAPRDEAAPRGAYGESGDEGEAAPREGTLHLGMRLRPREGSLRWGQYCPLPGSAASAPDALRPREGRLRPGTRLHPGRPPRPRPLREGTVSARDALLCGECTPRVRLRPL